MFHLRPAKSSIERRFNIYMLKLSMDNSTSEKLRRLGLTNQEIKIYSILSTMGAMNARKIAEETSIITNAVYRTARRLAKKGFITITEKYPTEFKAISLEISIPISVSKQVRELESLLGNMDGTSVNMEYNPHPTEIQLVYGANNIYEEGARLLDLSNKEMLVISIGEPISPNLLLSVRKARGRNVAIKMIAHKYDKENYDVLENLKKNGYEIRHYPDWGFHMAIYDQVKTLLIVNNPENTSERVAMFINSPGLSKALHDYFFSVWKKAKII